MLWCYCVFQEVVTLKISNTTQRLRELMDERDMRQVDVLRAAQPHCEQLGVKLGRNDLSQNLSGKVEPGQFKLTVLGLTFDVHESWLMGLDVPREQFLNMTISSEGPQITAKKLNAQGLERRGQYAEDLAANSKYLKLQNDSL